MAELKCCPFCGGSADVVFDMEGFCQTVDDPGGSNTGSYAVKCENCLCGLYGNFDRASAIDAWNKRV